MKDTKFPQRVLSIDILRGLTILVMIFVNDLASVKGLPWWTYHIPAGENGITYVDVVFPAFLFIVGMAIPLALNKRRTKGDSTLKLMYHTIIRALSLVAIGLLIMNGRDVNAAYAGISYGAWNVLMFIGVILLWNVYPKAEGKKQLFFNLLKWSGFILLGILLIIYRRDVDGEAVWMNFKTWSILGLIGWAYLSVVLIYLITRGNFLWLLASFVLLTALNVASRAGYVNFLHGIPSYIWPVGNGSLASITMAGVLLTRIFIHNDVADSITKKIRYGLIFSVVLAISGWILLPFGLAKIGATPSWCLLSSAICIVIFIFLYWLVDLKHISAWAGFMKPAGSNPLLTYILPDIYYALFGVIHFVDIAGEGWLGVLRAILFSLLILGISAVMTKWKIRLQL